jgi:hypothetical protein
MLRFYSGRLMENLVRSNSKYRDLNASKNILRLGLQSAAKAWIPMNLFVEVVTPAVSDQTAPPFPCSP